MAYPLFHPKNAQEPPMVMTLADFRDAFPGEDDYVEFKQGLSGEKVPQAAVAFSNSDGGVVLMGVADDGTVHGLEVTGETRAAVHRLMAEILNPGRYELFDLTVGDKALLVLAVRPRHEGISQTSKGVPLVRRGAMNTPLVGDELAELLLRRRLRRFELEPTPVKKDAADPSLLDRVASAWGWRSDDRISDRLVERGLVTADRPARMTVAGALYLLAEPSSVLGKSYVEVFRFPDESATQYDKRTPVNGTADQQVVRATEMVMQELGYDLVVLGVQRYELPRLPEVVVREAIANAVAHRSYELNGSAIRVEIRPGRVTVESPGGLPEPVTVENMRDQNAARNVVVIETLRRFGLAEDAGRGVDVMVDTMEEQLLDPPSFEDTGSSVVVTLPLHSTVAPEERAWINEMRRRGTIRGADRILLVHAARGVELTNQYVRDLLGVDSVIARSALQRLRDAGFLTQVGQRGGAQYRLVSELSPPAGLRLDHGALCDLVEELARSGPVTNALVRERTGLDRPHALALLNSLVEQGRLRRIGERRGSRYVLRGRDAG
jgi:ATP-dependent DNA helicase RecG